MRETARDVAIYSCTQVGKTFWAACWITAKAWEKPGSDWGWYAPTEKQMKIGFNEVIRLFALIIVPNGISYSDHTILLINDSKVQFYTWSVNMGDRGADTLQGPPLDGGVVDEAGLLTKRAVIVISSRRSATLGPMRYIGNPGITTGHFRSLCRRGESSERNKELIATYRWTWRELANTFDCSCPKVEPLKLTDDPIHSTHQRKCKRREYIEFIAEEKITQPDVEYRRLYEAEWTADENSLFRPDAIQSKTTGAPWKTAEPGHRYEIGVDVGQETDWLVAAIWDRETWRIGRMERWRHTPYPESEQKLADIARKWNNAILHVELNGPGLGVFQHLQRRKVRVQGWNTTASSKTPAVYDLINAIHDPDHRMTMAPLPPLQEELETYRYERLPAGSYRYSAPSGLHDDCVIAAMIGFQALRTHGTGPSVKTEYVSIYGGRPINILDERF